MRCPLVIVCLEGGEQPFAICADKAEQMVEELNRSIPDDERCWQVHTKPFPPEELEEVMEEMIYGPRPVPTPEVVPELPCLLNDLRPEVREARIDRFLKARGMERM